MNSSYQSSIIDLLRHGAIAGDAGLYGHTDVALSESGWRQMQQSVNIDLQYQQVISSPLQRCHRFAKDYSRRHALQLNTDPQLREMNFGDWDGHTFDHLQTRWPELEKFWQAPAEVTPPEGESLLAFTVFFHLILRSDSRGWPANKTDLRINAILVLAQLLCVNWQSADYYQHLRIDYGSITRIQVLYTEDGVYPQIRFIGRPSPAI